jgi:DUF4097 and DUF4098 domain-containing protein YvlB
MMSAFGTSTRNVLVIALIAPLGGTAQTAERFTLSGNSVAVYNIAGEVTVARGTGNAVVVEVSRGGAEASQLRMVERTVNGRPALCVVYPSERILYRRDGQNRRNTTTHTNSGDPCAESRTSWLRRRVEVGTSGSGVEAWADLRILVPQGRDVHVDQLVGRVDVDGVDAALNVDVASAPVTTTNTSGELAIDAGSGRVNVTTHRGALSVDVGSGAITIDDVETQDLTLDTGSGTITGTRVVADQLLVDTGSGNVDLSAASVRSGRIHTGSGRVRLSVTSIDNLDVDTGSGSVTLSVANELNARLAISTGSGGISTDFPVQVNRTSRNSLRGTVGSGGGTIRINTGSGAVRLVRGTGG